MRPRRAALALLATFGLAAGAATLNGMRFSRSVARDARRLLDAAAPSRRIDRSRLDRLPAPMHAYLQAALCRREQTVRSVRFRHDGRFKPSLDGGWQAIRGAQHDTADPPAFVWHGRIAPVPGLWVDARDRSVDGRGGMLVSLESSLTLADRSGPELDQGALLRLLSDLVLMPTAFLDERYVSVSGVDATHTRVTLRVGSQHVTGTFEFGDDGLPRSFAAKRYFDSGKGQPVLRPWSGEYGDYREVAGMLIPHRFVGYWHVDGHRVAYADFLIDAPEYDVAAPY